MTETQTRCPHCGFAYAVTPEQAAAMAGQSFACTNCGRPFTLSPSGAAFPQSVAAQVTYASASETKSNPLAIASLICGCLLCVPFAPGIAAIACGAIGMRKTKDPTVSGKGLAIAGLVLGILNVLGWAAYFGLIFALMVPSLGRARETANRVKCASNLRQVGLAIANYASDNGGAYPDTLGRLHLAQDIDHTCFVCPTTTPPLRDGTKAEEAEQIDAGKGSYIYVGKGLKSSASAEAIVAYEPMTNHNGDGTNILFGDGHVEFITKARAERMIKQVEAGQNPPEVGVE